MIRNMKTITAFSYGILSSFLCGTLGLMLLSPFGEPRIERVFVYATLTNPIARAYACVCLTELTPAQLSGYKRINKNIIIDPDNAVLGGIIMVSESELAHLDDYEDLSNEYRRTEVTIDGQPTWVYIEN